MGMSKVKYEDIEHETFTILDPKKSKITKTTACFGQARNNCAQKPHNQAGSLIDCFMSTQSQENDLQLSGLRTSAET